MSENRLADLDDTVSIEGGGKSTCSKCGVLVPGVGFGTDAVKTMKTFAGICRCPIRHVGSCADLAERLKPDPFKARVAALLKSIEFSGESDSCPTCGLRDNHVIEGHRPDCALAALLREAEGA